MNKEYLGVAQSGRAPVLGTGGWEFESLHSDRARRFYFIIWVWLNPVEHRLGEPAIGSSNLPTQTRRAFLF
jgi:hypothetical protein